MRRRIPALAGLCSVIVLLAGACSEDQLIGDDRDGGAGAGAAPSAPAGPIDPDAAARVAVRLWSCGLGDLPEVILDRFYTHVPGPDDAIDRLVQGITCVELQNDGCAGVKSCLGISATTSTTCTDGCIGDVLHTCDGITERTMDCAKLGLACAPDVKRCLAAPLGPTCDAASPDMKCSGSVPEGCAGRIVHGPDCASLGLSCGLVDLGVVNAVCQGEGAACDGESVSFYGVHFGSGVACDGDLLRSCVSGTEHLVDCASRGKGFTCQTSIHGAFCGLAADCVPGAAEPTCGAGTKSLTVCNAGRIDHVACDAMGFAGCDVDHCGAAGSGP